MDRNITMGIITSVAAFVIGAGIPVYNDYAHLQAQAKEEQTEQSVVKAIQKLYSIPYVSHHLPG